MTGTKMDAWTPLVKAALVARFGPKTDALCALLLETGSLISGGSILSACIEEPILKQDTDIYVPVKHIPQFLTSFVQGDSPIFIPKKWNYYAASFYCSSFLRKNGIRKVYNFADMDLAPADWAPVVGGKVQLVDTFVLEEDDERCLLSAKDEMIGTVIEIDGDRVNVQAGWRKTKSWYLASDLAMGGLQQKHEVDIMAVRNKRGPLAVVNNFDLTFCQVWFDGADVYASHPEHIKEKKGELRYEYCLTLFGGNKFLKRRIAKYMGRGFSVNFDRALDTDVVFKDILSKLGSSQATSQCTIDNTAGDRYDSPEFKQRWFNRIAMRYFLGIRSGYDYDSDDKCLAIPLTDEVHSDQISLVEKDKLLNQKYFGKRSFGKMTRPLPFNEFTLRIDDGYDSDDMTADELKRIAVEKYAGAADPDLAYYRTCTNLVFNSKVKRINGAWTTLAEIASKPYRRSEKAKKLLGFIEDLALREGDDMFGATGKLYDIHEHSVEQGITQESLEGYLESTMVGDEYDVKCYAAGGGAHVGCTKKLLLREIEFMVSADFFERYSAPRPKKIGLDQNVGNFDNVLRNIKSYDTGWGDIYHSTMCPYCLSFDERGEGCSVMTHVNTMGADADPPYCQKDKQVAEIVAKYKAAGTALDGGYIRLEWCVECGCPGSSHKHFSFDLTRMIEHNKIADPRYPGEMKYDYGSCPGGGRPELIARMLAVRDVYRRRNIRDPKMERKQAALAADKAPLDAGLMARARTLWAAAQPGLKWRNNRQDAINAAAKEAVGKTVQEIRAIKEDASKAFSAANPKPADVDFDIPIPKSKKYSDPLYEKDAVEDNVDYQRWLNGPEAAVPVPAESPLMTAAKARATAVMPDVPANVEQGNWNKEMLPFLGKFIEKAQSKPNLLELIGEERFEHIQTLFATALSTHINGQAEIIDLNLLEVFVLYLVSIINSDIAIHPHIISRLAKAQVLGGDRVKNSLDEIQITPVELSKIKDLLRDSLVKYFIAEQGQAPGPGGARSFRRVRGKTDKRTKRKTRKLVG